jgi:SOS response regulatory protein OraA/RecX
MDNLTHACIRDVVNLAKTDRTPKQITSELRRRGYELNTIKAALAYCADTLKEGE